MKNWIVKAFHTGGPYQKDADNLQASAKKFGIPIDIEVIESRGNWNLNTHYKPRSILNAMEKHDATHIIHIDADTWFMQYPALFDELNCDIGAFYYGNWKTWCSGTVVVRNCGNMLTFLHAWEHKLKTKPTPRGDQTAMGELLEGPDSMVEFLGLNVVRIPAGYLQGLAPKVIKGEGVIAHVGGRKRYAKDGIAAEPR